MYEHSREAFNLLALLAEFGGLFAVVSKLFAVIGQLINERVHASGMLNEMYYLKLSDKQKEKKRPNFKKISNNLHEIDFSTWDRFAEIKKALA
jgi:hypothetical protein